MLISSKIYYVRTHGGKDTLLIEGSLIYKAIEAMHFEAGCVQDGNKIPAFTASMTNQCSS